MVIQSSFYDPVLGLDTHLVGIPAPPAPVPVPTPIPIPFVGLVFDPAGLVIGAAMGMALSGSAGVVLIHSMPVTNCGTEVAGKLGVPHVPLPGVNFTKTMGPLYTSNDAALYFGANETTLGGSLGVRLGDVALSAVVHGAPAARGRRWMRRPRSWSRNSRTLEDCVGSSCSSRSTRPTT